jgi:predicted Rossmann-fold nucleotide-binding protein
MGAVADGVLNGGGTVIGVILIFRSKEIAHNGLTELIVVDSMHEGKRK